MESVDLTHLQYAVFGSGDYIYEFFCKSVDDFDKKMKRRGADKIMDSIKFELEGNENDQKKIKELAAKIAEILLS